MSKSVDHNTVASMARIALMALEKPLEDGPIYNLAKQLAGYWVDSGARELEIAEWAKAQWPCREVAPIRPGDKR